MKTPSPARLSWALTVAVAVSVLLLALSRRFYLDAAMSPFFACALAGAAILHFGVAPRRDVLFVIGGTAILGTIVFAGLRFPHGPTVVVPAISLMGLSSLLVFGVRTVWSEGEERGLYLRAFIPAVLFVASEYAASTLLEITGALHPKTLDLCLYSFDASLGVQLSFALGRWFYEMAWLRQIALLFYIGLALPIALVSAALVRARCQKAVPAILAFLIMGPLGVLFYNIFPACGPKYVFGRAFPLLPLSMAQAAKVGVEAIAIAGPRNAIPSLHMAWVLLVWWNSNGLSVWIRGIGLLFLVFTVLSTLGTGEHYFIDLIVAFPFAVAVRAIADYSLPLRDVKRSRPLLGGLLLTLGWMAALSFAPPQIWWASPVIGWALMGLTVLASLYLQRFAG